MELGNNQVFFISQIYQTKFFLKVNVADFLSLGKIEYVSLPISINIILIGFEGNGNGGILD